MGTETIDLPISVRTPTSQRGEPAWEIAHLFPPQGYWSESDYLALGSKRLIEYVDGCIEVPPMPTFAHHLLVDFLVARLREFLVVNGIGGRIAYAPIPVWLYASVYREPDVFYLKENRCTNFDKYPKGADLVIEVVSGGSDDRERDYVRKRADYAKGGVPEYWIVDPQERKVVVLVLAGDDFETHGTFGAGESMTSATLPGFSMPVVELFAAMNPSPGAG